MRERLCAYNYFSDSARKLSREMRIKRVRPPAESAYVPRAGDVIINWGSSSIPETWQQRCGYILNSPDAVRLASNKLRAFELLNSKGIKIPKYTLDVEVARKWARRRIVFGRRLLRSSSGRGIEIYKRPEDVREGLPLYVRYVPKKDEYRVHVLMGEVIDIQKKMRRSGEFLGDPEIRNMVRNYDNGWVFGRSGIAPPRDVIEQSIAAVAALGLDFGAVDVGWTENIQQATVYEVNTAPGLTGSTVTNYARAIRAEMYRRASRGY